MELGETEIVAVCDCEAVGVYDAVTLDDRAWLPLCVPVPLAAWLVVCDAVETALGD